MESRPSVVSILIVPPGSDETGARGRTLTQTRPSATTTSCGLAPTWIVSVTRPLLGLILVTVPSPEFATQTPPAPTAIPTGPWPTGVVLLTAPVAGSIRATASSSPSVTQTAPAPRAMATGSPATGMGLVIPVRASTRDTSPSAPTHTVWAPAVIVPGLGTDSIRAPPGSPVMGFKRITLPADGATHRARPASDMLAFPSGRLSTRIGARVLSKRASIRRTVTYGSVLGAPATQTAPSPAARSRGCSATAIVRPVLTGRTSMRVTDLSSRFPTQSERDLGSYAS